MSSFEILNFLVIFGLIIAALCVFFLDDILQCIIAMAVLGTFLALEFLLLKAPDVAIAEAAVGAILTPVIFIITLNKVKSKKVKEGEKCKKKITYIILFLLLALFSFIGVKMNANQEELGKASKIILNETISKTGAINSVTATVFDFRGYDTLGEAIVLFTAICGVATVLRVEKKVKEEK